MSRMQQWKHLHTTYHTYGSNIQLVFGNTNHVLTAHQMFKSNVFKLGELGGHMRHHFIILVVLGLARFELPSLHFSGLIFNGHCVSRI